MPWSKTPEERRRDAEVYGSAEYKRNSAIVIERAGGRYGTCSECSRRGRRLECDHIVPTTQGGGHNIENLRAICSGPSSCHAKKSAREGNRASRALDGDPQPRPTTTW